MELSFIVTAVKIFILCSFSKLGTVWCQLSNTYVTVLDTSIGGNAQLILHRLPGDPTTWMENLTDNTVLSTSRMPLTQGYLPTALAFDYINDTLISLDTITKSIRTVWPASASSPSTSTLYTPTSANVTSMSFDWLARNLYWVDSNFNWIKMVSLQTSFSTTVINTRIETPKGITVHPRRSLLFWSDVGSVFGPKIECSNLNGQNRVILTRDVTAVMALSIDHVTDRLYWVDSVRQTLESMLWDGSSRQTFVAGTSLSSLVVYGTYVYTLDDRSGSLRVFNKSSGQKYKSFLIPAAVKGISLVIATNTSQPAVASPCYSAGCQQLCVGDTNNAVARCMCTNTALLSTNGKSCSDASKIPSQRLLLASNNTLFSTEEIYFETKMLTFSNHQLNIIIQAIDSIFSQFKIFFASNKSIYYTARNDVTLYNVFSGIGIIQGLAIDWVSSNVYWTDSKLGKIMVSSANFLYKKIFTQLVDYPFSLCADSVGRRLYWSRNDVENPAIGVINMDGTNSIVLVIADLQSPSYLAFDIVYQRLYWTDTVKNTIESISATGNNRQTYASLRQPTFITIFQDYVVWTNLNSQIFFGLTSGLNASNTVFWFSSYYIHSALAVYSAEVQPLDTPAGPCSIDNGGCDQLCLPSKTNERRCQCVLGYKLSDNGVTCDTSILTSSFLLVTDSNLGGIYQIDIVTGDVHVIPVTLQQQPSAIAYNPDNLTVYWVDSDRNFIKYVTLADSYNEFRITLTDFISLPTISDMKIDAIDRRIYYTDNSNKEVASISLDGRDYKMVINTGPSSLPRALVVVPSLSKVYWTDCGSNPQISRTDLEGGVIAETIIDSVNLKSPNGLAIDAANDILFWCDGGLGRVESSTLNGSSRKLIFYSSSENFYDITIDKYFIYLTSWTTRGVMRLLRAGGGSVVAIRSTDFICLNAIDISAGNVILPDIVTSTSTSPRTYSASATTTGFKPTVQVTPESSGTTFNALSFIIGGVVGLVAIIIIVVVIVIIVVKRKKKPAALANHHTGKGDDAYEELDRNQIKDRVEYEKINNGNPTRRALPSLPNGNEYIYNH